MNAWPATLGGRPSAAVFDCDGLLVDTETSWGRAEERLFGRRGVPYGPDEREALLGTSVPSSVVWMAGRFDEAGNEAGLLAELLEAAHDLIGRESVALPGAAELVARLREYGVPIAVASNSPRPLVDLALGVGGLGGAFDLIVSADDVSHPKPAPDPYLTACSGLGIDPSAAVAFEDSPPGLASARAAGMATVCVPSRPGDYEADWVLPSLADPALGAWVASWA